MARTTVNDIIAAAAAQRVGVKAADEGIVAGAGVEPRSSTPEELAAVLKRDIPKYKKLMVDAGIVPQ